MNDYHYEGEPTKISRDAGYSKLESLSLENRIKSRERMNNSNIVSGDWSLKEVFAKVGITVNPDKLTHLFKYD